MCIRDRACEALELSPYCTGAYNLLAEESDCLEEKTALYRRGVRAGELSLGELFFKKNAGHFWSIMETRPYTVSYTHLDVYKRQGYE